MTAAVWSAARRREQVTAIGDCEDCGRISVGVVTWQRHALADPRRVCARGCDGRCGVCGWPAGSWQCADVHD